MRAKIGALVMAALLVLYLVFVAQYAFLLIGAEPALAKVIGVALLILPLVGAWALVVELIFAVRAERLAKILGEEGLLPVDTLPKLPSGRPIREAADAEFPAYQAEVEAAPESWRAWYRLGLAYAASGDGKRARWATRKAISMERARS